MAIKRLIIVAFLSISGLSSQSLFAQEQILKDFAENSYERKFCFYPSTIRMINLKNDPEYNAMVRDIEKLLIYALDSAGTFGDGLKVTLSRYEEKGYEEYARLFGNGYNVHILGIEEPGQEWVGLFKLQDQSYAFYLKGMVNWQKLPKMMETLQDNELLDFMSLDKPKKKSSNNHGK